LTYKHRIIEVFVTKALHMNKREAHEEAHRLEHAFSDKAIEKLRLFLKNPKSCPHGSEIKLPAK